MVAVRGLGTKCSAGGIRMLGMVAQIHPSMAEVWLGDGISDCLLFGDGFCLPLPMMAAEASLQDDGLCADSIVLTP
jgi:hypothetical protein